MTEDLFQQLIDYANQCIAYHARDTAHMKNFLRFLARLKTHNVSVANKVLICGYSPNALDVRTEEDWALAGVHVIHPEQMIHNLYRPDKGNYTDRIMYDITATDGVYIPFPKYKESWLITIADKTCAASEIWHLWSLENVIAALDSRIKSML